MNMANYLFMKIISHIQLIRPLEEETEEEKHFRSIFQQIAGDVSANACLNFIASSLKHVTVIMTSWLFLSAGHADQRLWTQDCP